MASPPKNILLVGLDPLAPPPNAPVPPSVLQSIAAKIDLDVARAARNGFPCTKHYLDWRDAAAAFARLEEVVRNGPGGAGEGEGAWDAVLIGQGLRQWKDPVLFEGVVDVLRRGLGVEVKIVFNDGADRQCAALERVFGVEMGE